jgi:AcrR family transcriptional regulator
VEFGGLLMDRRKRKTRIAIQKACIELIQEKDFDTITISDIAERADINRATFYLHFVDKHDMLDQFEQEIMDEISANFTTDFAVSMSIEEIIQSRYEPLVKVFSIIQDKSDIIDLLFQTKGVRSIHNRFHTIALKMFDNKFAQQHTNTPFQTPELFISVIVSTMIGIAHYWINSEDPKTPESLAIDLITIIINGPARAAGLIESNVIDVETLINKHN